MRICQDHWDRLREAVEQRGMADLIAPHPNRAITNLATELERGEPTLATYDPLMAAMWSVLSNATETIGQAAGASTVAYLMQPEDVPEDACELPGANGRTWPRCPICYLGLAHELTCREQRCKLPKVDGYAWMIDRAADDQLETWKKLQAAERGEGRR